MKALALLALVALVLLSVTTGGRVEPLVVYNPSQSVPSGFYMRAGHAPRTGDLVVVASAAVAPEYAVARGFADPTDRFLKRVAASHGQVICAEAEIITIDGVQVAERAAADPQGRTLPTWRGCRTLAADQVFLLGDTEDSFDGRYWGPTHLRDIDGVWSRL